jgi:hypothetical protein
MAKDTTAKWEEWRRAERGGEEEEDGGQVQLRRKVEDAIGGAE